MGGFYGVFEEVDVEGWFYTEGGDCLMKFDVYVCGNVGSGEVEQNCRSWVKVGEFSYLQRASDFILSIHPSCLPDRKQRNCEYNTRV